MADDFTRWQRAAQPERQQSNKERFVSKARHVHRYDPRVRINPHKVEAERDRRIFIWIMIILAAIALVFAISVFMVTKQEQPFKGTNAP